MSYSTAEGREQVLEAIGAATDDLAEALAALGEAYELLDGDTADRLEERLFGPTQRALGRLTRTHASFASRSGLEGREAAPTAPVPLASRGVHHLVEDAVEAAQRADAELGELQDSLLPIEVGDEELRAGLAEVRRGLEQVSGAARDFLRTLGR